MELNGTQVIAADRATVWAALNDTETLQACISGCEELERVSPTELKAIVKQKIGPVSAKFAGEITLTDIVEGEKVTIVGEGKGGAAGFAKGSAIVTLTDVEGGTQLDYTADARVGGKLAQIGSRLVASTARKVADEFFMKFRARVAGEDAEAITPAAIAAGASVAAAAPAAATFAQAEAESGAGLFDEPDMNEIESASIEGQANPTADDIWENARETATLGAAPAIDAVDESRAIVEGASDDLAARAEQAGEDLTEQYAAGKAAVADSADAASAVAHEAVDRVDSETSRVLDTAQETSSAAYTGAAAAAGGIGATVAGYRKSAEDYVVEKGKDIDEAAAWSEAKEHVGDAVDHAKDAVGDAVDAAKAKLQGATDEAASEWAEAKQGASAALDDAKEAVDDAWTSAKGAAAYEVQKPAIGPMGQPWYMWVMGGVVALILLFWLF